MSEEEEKEDALDKMAAMAAADVLSALISDKHDPQDIYRADCAGMRDNVASMSDSAIVRNFGIMLDLISEKRDQKARFYMEIARNGVILSVFTPAGKDWRRLLQWDVFSSVDERNFRFAANEAFDRLKTRTRHG